MKPGYSMPRVAPLYEAPPYIYQGNQSINILFKTTPETLQALVPAPLVPNPDSVLFIYIAQFNVETPTRFSYLEMGLGAPASFSETVGQYAVYLYLDKVGAIVPGREIYGWPKKDAEIFFTEQNNVISAQVVRDDVVLVDARLHLLERVDPIPPQPVAPWFNLKLIPCVKNSAPPDVMQLTSTLIESDMKELITGSATLKLGSSVSDPLGDIRILEILEGRYTVDDISLGYGDVIYDYLTESE
ncbi:MAG TPA: acetoacetate decarboxylase family protein [Anaerolineales bacterium]|nr:acetoacetate decarboxylase family protein [Anaerolineales bacterium]